MNTTTDTTDPLDADRATARLLRETADRCLSAADALDPVDPAEAFPAAEVAVLNLLRDLDAEPRSISWAVTVGGQECLLGWTSYPIGGHKWHLWWNDPGHDDDRHGRSVYGDSAAEVLDLAADVIAERVAS